METWTQPPLFTETRTYSVPSSEAESGPRRTSRTSGSAQPIVEPLAPGYRYLRDNSGVMPYAHLIGSWAENGASRTLCGRVGTKLSNENVSTMIRCGLCDAAQQLANAGTIFEA